MSTKCPKCNKPDCVSAVTSENRGGTGIFLLGGLLSYLLHRESHKNRLLCGRCDIVFAAHKTASPTRIIATSLFLLFVVAAAFYFAWKTSASPVVK
jgi:hypothetical protein